MRCDKGHSTNVEKCMCIECGVVSEISKHASHQAFHPKHAPTCPECGALFLYGVIDEKQPNCAVMYTDGL
jgi:hypothetical protein